MKHRLIIIILFSVVLGVCIGMVSPRPLILEQYLLQRNYEEKKKTVLVNFRKWVDNERIYTDIVGMKLYVRGKGDWIVTKDAQLDVYSDEYLYDSKVKVFIRLKDYVGDKIFDGLVKLEYDSIYNQSSSYRSGQPQRIWFTDDMHVLKAKMYSENK